MYHFNPLQRNNDLDKIGLHFMQNDLKKAKFKWRSRRGMLELDLILTSFLEHHFDELNETQKNDLETLLSYDDPHLFDWLMGYKESPNELRSLIESIKLYNYSK